MYPPFCGLCVIGFAGAKEIEVARAAARFSALLGQLAAKQPDIPLLTAIVNGSFATHPYTWTKDIFSTNVHPESLAENAALYKNVAGYNGHIVVRVAPGGAEYYVYMLDDTDFDYKVTSIHGPYSSK